MPNVLEFDDAARRRLERGVAVLASTVRVTLGPKGRNVVIGQDFGPPVIVTNDGVRVAKVLHLEDAHENLGLQLAREVAAKTNDDVGDGTTTATVLAHAIIRRGMRAVAAGIAPDGIKRGIDAAVEAISSWLTDHARPVDSRSAIAAVATVSAQEASIGELIAEAFASGGKDSVIQVEESPTPATDLVPAQGLRFDRGYLSPYLVTDLRRGRTILRNPLVLLHHGKITSAATLIPLLEKVSQVGRSLFVVAEDVSDEALSLLVTNKVRGTLLSMAVKAPLFGDRRKEMLDDIAVLTGARAVSVDAGHDLATTDLRALGTARRAIVDKGYSTIIEGGGNAAEIEARKSKIRIEMESTASDWDRERLRERLAKLSGALSVIRVAAATEIELREHKHRVEDAIAATRAAVEEGIVAGGGAALVHSAAALESGLGLDGDESVGVRIVREALCEPLHWIAQNAGDNGYLVTAQVSEQPLGHGYNAATGNYGDLIEQGVADPVKVTRSALENAASIAGLLLTTEALIADKSQPAPPAPAGPENLDPDDDD